MVHAISTEHRSTIAGYKPLVLVQTKKLNKKVEIKVSDNGNAIPQNIIDKTFQPFFTTKPTGERTGMGLSLSYDIIKAPGGEIKVETKEGKVLNLKFNFCTIKLILIRLNHAITKLWFIVNTDRRKSRNKKR